MQATPVCPRLSSAAEPPLFTIQKMLNALRYYWIAAKGYRLQPWKSPYLRWRMETFFGPAATDLDARKFLRLMWTERARMRRFLAWVAERRREQKRHSF
ncbi:MAG: hypothetical protein WAN10_02475 [Candidatus Acidiferrales bacterium]